MSKQLTNLRAPFSVCATTPSFGGVSSCLPRAQALKRGFALAPILYLIALAGIAGTVLFTGYTQILRSNVEITADNTARNQIRMASEVLASRALLNGTPPSLIPRDAVDFATLDAARLPKNIIGGAAGTTVISAADVQGDALSVGGLPTEGGVRALDPWGRYYIYCRWESPQSPGDGKSMAIISAGADGKLKTSCADAQPASGSDDRMEFLPVANVLSRAATWQAQGDNSYTFGVAGDPTAARVVVGLDGDSVDKTRSLDIGGKGRFRGDLQIDGDLGVNGTATMGLLAANGATITNSLSLGGNITSGGNAVVSGDLRIGGTTALNSLTAKNANLETLTAGTGVITALTASTLTTNGNATIDGSFTVKGTTALADVTGGAASFGNVTANTVTTSRLVPNSGALDISGSMAVSDTVQAANGVFTNLTVTNPINATITGSAGSANNVPATGITGVVPITAGGTGASTAIVARSNLGLQIGVNVQGWSQNLDYLAALSTTGFVRNTGAGFNAGPILQAEVPAFTGATASAQGTLGGVPTPLAGQQNYVLTGAGTWTAVTNLTGSQVEQGDSGIYVDDTGTGVIRFKIDGSEQARITGVANADRAVKMTGGTAATPPSIGGYAATGSSSLRIAGQGAAGNLYFTTNGTDRLVIDASSGAVTAANGFVGNLTGNADTATKLVSARSIALSGDATATGVSFDGSGNITIPTSVVKLQGTAVSSTAPVSGQVLTYDGTAWVPGSAGSSTVDGGVIGATQGIDVKLADGTVGQPSLRFLNNTNMGLYRVGANTMGFATNGINRVTISNTGLGVAGTNFTAGANGTTNPAFSVDASAASAATGLAVQAAAAGSGVTLQTLSSGTNEALNIASKGMGAITLKTPGAASVIVQSSGTNIATFDKSAFTFAANATAVFGMTTPRFSFTGFADTGLTTGTEATSVYFNSSQTRTHVAGNYATQRDFRISPSTHAFSGASTITNAVGLYVDGPPIAGTNATFTNSHGLYVGTQNVGAGTTSAYGLTVYAPTGATNNYAASFMDGGVGIGTAMPTATLDVVGGARIGRGSVGIPAVLYLDNTASLSPLTGNGSSLSFRVTPSVTLGSVGAVAEANTATGSLLFWTNLNNTSTEKMRITSVGRVGVGTNAPATLLDVAGGMKIGNETATCASGLAGTMRWNGTQFEACDGATWQGLAALGGTPANYSNPFYLTPDATNLIAFGANGSGTAANRQFLQVTADKATGVVSQIDIFMGGSSKISIDSAGRMTSSLNNGGGAANINVKNANNAVGSSAGFTLYNGGALAATFSSEYVSSSSADLTFGTRGSSNLTEKMRLMGSGRLGIGTAAPATMLEVVGGVKIGAETGTCASGLAGTMRYDSTNNFQVCVSTDGGTTYAWQTVNVTNTVANPFYITPDASNLIALGANGTGTAANRQYLKVTADATTGVVSQIEFMMGGSNVFSIDGGGRLNSTLLNGLNASNLSLRNTSSSIGSTSGLDMYNSNSILGVFVRSELTASTSMDMTFGTRASNNLTEKMRITAVGRIGIGTSAPATQLEVVGGVKIGNETGTCASGLAGTMRYNSTNNFQVCVSPDGGTTYAWQTVNVTNTVANPFYITPDASNAIYLGANGTGTAANRQYLKVTADATTGVVSQVDFMMGGGSRLLIDSAGRLNSSLSNGADAKNLSLKNTLGSAGSTSGIDFYNGVTLNTYLRSEFVTSTSMDMTFGTRGSNTLSEKMRLMGSGRLGIGTAAPATQLEVVGGVKIGNETGTCASSLAGTMRYDSTNNFQVCVSTDSGTTYAWQTVNVTNTVANPFYLTPDATNFIYYGANGTDTAANRQFMKVTADATTGTVSQLDLIMGGSSKFYMDSTGRLNSVINNGADAKNLSLKNTSTATNSTAGIDFYNGFAFSAYLRSLIASGSNNNDLTFGTRGSGSLTEKMRLMSNGRLGIGTSAPATMLEVVGGVKIGSETGTCASGLAGTMRYDSTNNFQVCVSTDGGTTYAWQTVNISNTVANPFYLTPDASNLITFGANGSGTAANRQFMKVTADATTGTVSGINFVIGGTSYITVGPTGRIISSLNNGNDATNLILKNANTTAASTAGLEFWNGGGATGYLRTEYVNSTNTDMTFFIQGSNSITERLRIKSTGRVGIGTSAPATQLEVVGGVKIGAETGTCASGLAGTMRYDSTNNFQVCVSTDGGTTYAWQTVNVTNTVANPFYITPDASNAIYYGANGTGTAANRQFLKVTADATTGVVSQVDFMMGGGSRLSIDSAGRLKSVLLSGGATNNIYLTNSNGSVGSAAGIQFNNGSAIVTGYITSEVTAASVVAADLVFSARSSNAVAERMRLSGAGYLGLGTNAPTHTLTLASTGTGVTQYNTSDQTTNYERLREYWNSNVYTIATEKGGTGTARSILISTPSGGALALNPAGSVTVQSNGNSVATFTSSDFTFTSAVDSTVVTPRFGFTGFADTALPASTEAPSVYFNSGQTRTHATGNIATQRDFWISPSTHAFAGASTITNAVGIYVDGPPIAGTNATFTNSHGLYVGTQNVGSGTTNAYGLTVYAPTGATNNYAAAFNGAVTMNGFLTGTGFDMSGTGRVAKSSNGYSASTFFVDNSATPANSTNYGAGIMFRNASSINLGSIGGIAEGNGAIGALVFWTNTSGSFTEKMRLSATGKLGIGTTAPATKLEVVGGVKIGDETGTCASGLAGTMRYNSTNNFQVCVSTDGGTTYAWQTVNVTNTVANPFYLTPDASNLITFGANGTGTASTRQFLKVTADATTGVVSQMDVVIGGTTWLSINNLGRLSSTLNNGSAAANFTVKNANTAVGSSAGFDFWNGGGATGYLRSEYVNGTSADMTFGIRGSNSLTEKMRLTGSGRLGVGTSAPATQLEVVGGVKIGAETGTCASGLAGTMRYDSTNNFQVCISTDGGTTYAWQTINITNSNPFYTTPDASNAITFGANGTSTTANRQYMKVTADATTGVVTQLDFMVNGGSRLKLDFAGRLSSTVLNGGYGNNITLTNTSGAVGSGTNIAFSSGSSVPTGSIASEVTAASITSADMVFGVRSGGTLVDRMRLSGAGYLGLGTNAPTHTLTLPSASTGLASYNTSDQTTNYERLREYWNSNVFTIASEVGGTGTARSILISTPSGGALSLNPAGSVIVQSNGNSVATFTGSDFTFASAVDSTAVTPRFGFIGFADTALTAATEATSVYFNIGQTRTHATGNIATQRDFRISPSTHAFAGASTITNAAGMYIDGPPIAGTNATVTNSHGLYIAGQNVGSGTTNAYGLTVMTPSGATNNYSAYFSGSVGIGTTAPSSRLEVNGGARITRSGAGYVPSVLYVDNTYSTPPSTNNGSGIMFRIGPTVNMASIGGISEANTATGGLVFYTNLNNAMTEKMRVTSYGSVGIGTTTPSEVLEVVGNVKGTAFVNSSDVRLKDHIETLQGGLETIKKLRGVTFTWKKDGTKAVGLIAQEVEQVLPDLVRTDKEGYKAVMYANLVAPLIEAVKELAQKFDDLAAMVANLVSRQDVTDQRLKALEEKLEKISHENAQLKADKAQLEKSLKKIDQLESRTKKLEQRRAPVKAKATPAAVK